MPHNYKIIISYDGTCYSGWQIQPNGVTIQEIIQKTIKTILRKSIILVGAGRTDAGVHALGQVAHFHVDAPISFAPFLRSLNSLLPADIRVYGIEEVPLSFHAQYSAWSKVYHYHIHTETVQSPFYRLYRLHVREKIHIPLLKAAAYLFLGTHDFTSFANEAHSGCAAYNAVRTIQRLDIVEQEGGWRLEFEADGFLYKMVRNITGTLLEVASGKRSIEEIERILLAKDRRLAGKAAASHGLFLMQVNYPIDSKEEKCQAP